MPDTHDRLPGVVSGDALEDVLANWRERASAARRLRDDRVAELLDEFADDVARAAAPYLTWLAEADAVLYSGRSREWLRLRYPRWLEQGDARPDPRHPRARQYRMLVLPRRYDAEHVRADARAEARRIS